jgi:hypothetical protein
MANRVLPRKRSSDAISSAASFLRSDIVSSAVAFGLDCPFARHIKQNTVASEKAQDIVRLRLELTISTTGLLTSMTNGEWELSELV